MSDLLKAVDLNKTFRTAHREIRVLSECGLSLAAGESVGILGSSGSGKSTLLHILGTLDRPDSGELHFEDLDLLAASSRQLSTFRQEKLGFIFQFHHLLPEFSALENVAMPALIARQSKSEAFERAELMLERVGLAERVTHRPGELSGGEQQRVAVARALLNRPRIILADEPTGNLDGRTGQDLSDNLLRLIEEEQAGLIIVTHDRDLAARTDHRLRLEAGRLYSD